MAQDPGIGCRVQATITGVKGECGAGHRVGETFEISCYNPGGLCGWFYHDVFPTIRSPCGSSGSHVVSQEFRLESPGGMT